MKLADILSLIKYRDFIQVTIEGMESGEFQEIENKSPFLKPFMNREVVEISTEESQHGAPVLRVKLAENGESAEFCG